MEVWSLLLVHQQMQLTGRVCALSPCPQLFLSPSPPPCVHSYRVIDDSQSESTSHLEPRDSEDSAHSIHTYRRLCTPRDLPGVTDGAENKTAPQSRRMASVVKSACFSPRGWELCSQHPLGQLTTTFNFRGYNALLPTGTTACTHAHTHKTCIQIKRNVFLNN